MTTDSTKARLREFLARFLRNHDLSDNDDIFALGLVHSLLAMQLVAFVEKDFGITVEDEDLELDNFRTINAMVALVRRKQAATSGGHST